MIHLKNLKRICFLFTDEFFHKFIKRVITQHFMIRLLKNQK